MIIDFLYQSLSYDDSQSDEDDKVDNKIFCDHPKEEDNVDREIDDHNIGQWIFLVSVSREKVQRDRERGGGGLYLLQF